MRRGGDRQPVRRRVEADLGQRHGDRREPLVEVLQDGRVQPQVVHVLLDHPGGHGAGHLITGQQLVDELVAVLVPQEGTVAPEGLGEQRTGHLRVVQRGRVELDELDVAEHGAGPQGHGDAVAGGLRRGGGDREDLTRPTGGQQRVPGPDGDGRAVLGQGRDAAAAAVLHHEVDGEGVLVDLGRRGPGRGDEGPLDLDAGGGATGVHDAGLGMGARAGQRELPSAVEVEDGPEGDELVDPAGAFVDQHPYRRRVTEVRPRLEGVGDVQVQGVGVLVQHRGHPTLGPPCRGLVQHALGQETDPEAHGAGGPHGGREPGHPTAENEQIQIPGHRPRTLRPHRAVGSVATRRSGPDPAEQAVEEWLFGTGRCVVQVLDEADRFVPVAQLARHPRPVVAVHRQPAAVRRSVGGEGRQESVAVLGQSAVQHRQVPTAVLGVDQEVEDRPVVPEREGRPRWPTRHVGDDPGHLLGRRPETPASPSERGCGDVEHREVPIALGPEGIDQA